MIVLYLDTERIDRNKVNGQWLKGHKSPLKGRKRSEYMSKKTDERLKRIGGERLKSSPKVGARKRKVIAVSDDGRWTLFSSMTRAASKIGGIGQNISRCCRQNAKHGRNTDHKYMGIRFYYEDDNIWQKKIEH